MRMEIMRTLFSLILLLILTNISYPSEAEELCYTDSDGQHRYLTVASSYSEKSDRIAFKNSDDERLVYLGRGVVVMLDKPTLSPDPEIWRYSGLTSPRKLDRKGLVWLFQASGPRHALKAASSVARSSAIRWALPDFEIPIDLCNLPDDPWFNQQWYLDQSNGSHAHALDAWNITKGNPDAVVAVIDTGVDTGHPDFRPEHMLPGRDTWHETNNPSPGSQPWDGHGTCCAGLIGATNNNGEGISGLCPDCSLLPVRFMDGKVDITNYHTTLARGYEAIMWAVENGAWVISNSWEVGPTWIEDIDLEPFYEAIHNAQTIGRDGLGTVVVFASGNRGIELDARTLAAQPGVISVGATGPDDNVQEYSNFGASLTLVAPGGVSGYDNPEDRLFTTDVRGDGGFSRDGKYWMGTAPSTYSEPDETGNYTTWFNGTSAAAPLVSAAAALLLSVNPGLSVQNVSRILITTADHIGPLVENPDGHDYYYGNGRLNTGMAVRTARYGVDLEDGAECLEGASCSSGICYGSQNLRPGICSHSCTQDNECGDNFNCSQDGFCVPSNLDGDLDSEHSPDCDCEELNYSESDNDLDTNILHDQDVEPNEFQLDAEDSHPTEHEAADLSESEQMPNETPDYETDASGCNTNGKMPMFNIMLIVLLLLLSFRKHNKQRGYCP